MPCDLKLVAALLESVYIGGMLALYDTWLEEMERHGGLGGEAHDWLSEPGLLGQAGLNGLLLRGLPACAHHPAGRALAVIEAVRWG